MECPRCHVEIPPGAPVWRFRRRSAADTSRPRLIVSGVTSAGVCKSCAPDRPVWNPPYVMRERAWEVRPCEGCGREVSIEFCLGAGFKYWACSPSCWTRAVRLRKKAATQHTREKVCTVCGENFTAERSDAVTCSSPCRQKAYRRRARAS